MLPLILAIYNRETETSNRIALLQLIEKLNFRFYGTGIATRTGSGQGELFKLAHDFYNCHSKSHVDDVLIDVSWLKEIPKIVMISITENTSGRLVIIK